MSIPTIYSSLSELASFGDIAYGSIGDLISRSSSEESRAGSPVDYSSIPEISRLSPVSTELSNSDDASLPEPSTAIGRVWNAENGTIELSALERVRKVAIEYSHRSLCGNFQAQDAIYFYSAREGNVRVFQLDIPLNPLVDSRASYILEMHELFDEGVAPFVMKAVKDSADLAALYELANEYRCLAKLRGVSRVQEEAVDFLDTRQHIGRRGDSIVAYWGKRYVADLRSVQSKGLHMKELMKLTEQVAAGVFNAFQNGVSHNDVKPANFFLDENGDVDLGDFGCAIDHDRYDYIPNLGDCRYYAAEDYRSFLRHFNERREGSIAELAGRKDMMGTAATIYYLWTGIDRPWKVDQKGNAAPGKGRGLEDIVSGQSDTSFKDLLLKKGAPLPLVELLAEACDPNPFARPSPSELFHRIHAMNGSLNDRV